MVGGDQRRRIFLNLNMATYKKKRNHESDSEPEASDQSRRDTSLCSTWVKFYEILAKDEANPINKLSPFAIEKAILGMVGSVKSIKKLRKGSLLVEVASFTQSKNIAKIDRLANVPVLVSPHKSLNSSKGVIRTRELDGMSEADILSSLEAQHVTSVKRMTIKKGDNIIATGTYVLTFGVPELPSTLKLGYLKVRVDVFIPNPLRCFQCQKFGHGQLSCRGRLTCFRCGEAGHNGRECEADPKCRNCQGAHMAVSKDCPIWKSEKQIQQIKVTNNITFAEARKMVEISNVTKPTYANAVTSTKTTKSTECQTTLTWVKTNKPERFTEKPPQERPAKVSLGCQTEMNLENSNQSTSKQAHKQNTQTKRNSSKDSEKLQTTTPNPSVKSTTANPSVKSKGKNSDKNANIQSNRTRKGDRDPIKLHNLYAPLDDDNSDDMEIYYSELNQAQRAAPKSRSSRSRSPGSKRK